MNTGTRRRGLAGIVLGLMVSGMLLSPLAANAFDVVAGAAGNQLSLRVFRGTDPAAQGALAVDIVSSPAWVTSLTPASQIVKAAGVVGTVAEIQLGFDVSTVAVGSEGDIRLRIRSADGGSIDATKDVHLTVTASAPPRQEILTADCCALLVTGTTYVQNQRSLMFSVPLIPVPPATTFPLSQLGDDLGSQVFWTLRRWNPATSALISATSLTQGRAYFLRKNNGTAGDSVLVDVDGAELTSTLGFVSTALDSGFQEIATPYQAPVTWGPNVSIKGPGGLTVPADSAVALGWIEPAMYTLANDGSWNYAFVDDANGSLVPWSGGLVLPRVGGLQLSYAAAGAAAITAAPYHWRGTLTANVAAQSLNDTANRFGFAQGASATKDERDAVQPFKVDANHVDLFFDNGSWPTYPGRYVQDVRPAVIGIETWNVGVVVNGFATQNVSVSWDISEIPSPIGLTLIDGATQIDMRAQSSYVFVSGASGATKSLQVRVDASTMTSVGEVAAVPRSFQLGIATPNPFGRATEISYGVPASGGVVALRVYNVAGQLVKTLADGPATPGFHRVSWDGRDDNGASVKAGVYFYRLETPTMRETKKMTFIR